MAKSYKLVAGDPIPPSYTNTFVCEIETMIGDGDGDETVVTKIDDSNIGDLETLLKVLKKKGQVQDLSDVKDFDRFFGDDQPEYDMAAEWPYDSNHDSLYGYWRHSYFYYDSNGVKYNAKLARK